MYKYIDTKLKGAITLKVISGEFLDEKNRKVCLVEVGSAVERYYDGTDVQGIIMEDEDGEFIVKDGKKRYWKGVIDSLPDTPNLAGLNRLRFVILKPDCLRRNLADAVVEELERSGVKIMVSRRVTISEDDVYRLYPFFHTPEWEEELVEYISSGESLCIIACLSDFHEKPKQIRSRIRQLFKDEHEESNVVNIIHISDSPCDSLREALIFFDFKEVIPGGE